MHLKIYLNVYIIYDFNSVLTIQNFYTLHIQIILFYEFDIVF